MDPASKMYKFVNSHANPFGAFSQRSASISIENQITGMELKQDNNTALKVDTNDETISFIIPNILLDGKPFEHEMDRAEGLKWIDNNVWRFARMFNISEDIDRFMQTIDIPLPVAIPLLLSFYLGIESLYAMLPDLANNASALLCIFASSFL